MRTRAEHIAWCKERAITEMDYYKDPSKAIVSMMSDLRKHPETNDEVLIRLCMAQLITTGSLTRQRVINFIYGFY